jgi:hypothetical protein
MKPDTSNRSAHGTGRTRKPLVAAVAALGGAGVVLVAPGAALMTAPQVQAAPVFSAPQQLIPGFDFFGDGGLSAALLDPFFEIAGLIPVLNIFVGNGVDGTRDQSRWG